MEYVQIVTLEYGTCDYCECEGVCFAVTTPSGDLVACTVCVRERTAVEV